MPRSESTKAVPHCLLTCLLFVPLSICSSNCQLQAANFISTFAAVPLVGELPISAYLVPFILVLRKILNGKILNLSGVWLSVSLFSTPLHSHSSGSHIPVARVIPEDCLSISRLLFCLLLGLLLMYIIALHRGFWALGWMLYNQGEKTKLKCNFWDNAMVKREAKRRL